MGISKKQEEQRQKEELELLKKKFDEMECVLVDLLVKYKNSKTQYKTWTGLSNYIEERTGYKYDNGRLKKIGEMQKEEKFLSFAISDLKALYLIFDEEDRKILEPLFAMRPKLFASMFAPQEKMDIFLAAIDIKEQSASMINRYHVRAFETIADSKRLDHLKVKFIDVIQRDSRKEDFSKRQWYKTLYGQNNSVRVTISHPYVNVSAEHMLAKIFDLEPYKPDYSKKLPLRLYFPDENMDKKNLPASSIDITKDAYMERYGEGKIRTSRRGFILNGREYISPRRSEIDENEELKSYGVLVMRYIYSKPQKDHILHMSILGIYAPDNLGISYRVFESSLQIPAKLPRPKQGVIPQVLIVLFKNIIGMSEDDLLRKQEIISGGEEWRKIKQIEIVDAQLWEKHKHDWSLRENSRDANDCNKFVGELRGIEKTLDVEDLY